MDRQVMGKEKGKNAYGLYDMIGNVSEWCQDWYDKDWYLKMPERNPANTQKNEYRVVRGGSWLCNPEAGGWFSSPGCARTSRRMMIEPTQWANDIGIRCACDANQ